MTNDARRVSQLNITSTVSANDRVVVLTNPATAANTQTITLSNFATILAANVLPIATNTSLGVVKVDGSTITISPNGTISSTIVINGPYSNDSVAATSNVAIGSLYYTPSGTVQIRLV